MVPDKLNLHCLQGKTPQSTHPYGMFQYFRDVKGKKQRGKLKIKQIVLQAVKNTNYEITSAEKMRLELFSTKVSNSFVC